jgi:hypothetical protein
LVNSKTNEEEDPAPKTKTERKRKAIATEAKAVNLLTLRRKVMIKLTNFRQEKAQISQETQKVQEETLLK